MRRPVGFVPAAGRGTRYCGAHAIKELHPLRLASREPGGEPETRPICALALEAIATAGAERCIIVISPDKVEIQRALGERTKGGMDLSYVVQRTPSGIPRAVGLARGLLAGRDVVLALPDTVHVPCEALLEVHRRRLAERADVMLGVFPVADPSAFGPVEFHTDGTVRRVLDKPAAPAPFNTWGVASWSPRFTEFCTSWDEEASRRSGGERVLGDAFDAARLGGLRVRACAFPAGGFGDVGTSTGLADVLEILDRHGRLASPARD